MAKKAEAERAALAAGPSTSSGEPDPKKAKTDSAAGEGSESAAAAAGPPPSAGDGANKAPSDGSSGAEGEKAAEGPPAVPVKVLVQRQIIML